MRSVTSHRTIINPLDDLTPLYREGKRKMVDEEDLSKENFANLNLNRRFFEQSEEHGGENDDELINKCYHPLPWTLSSLILY